MLLWQWPNFLLWRCSLVSLEFCLWLVSNCNLRATCVGWSVMGGLASLASSRALGLLATARWRIVHIVVR